MSRKGSVIFACIAFAALAAGTGASFAQQTSTRMEGLSLSSDEPIQIESDKLQIKDKDKRADFTGNVKVVQGTTTIRSGAMTVYYRSEGGPVSGDGPADIDHILMSKRVLMTSGTQTASGDEGTFDMDTEILTLTGKPVVLTEGENVFTGCKLTVLMKSGEAQLEACGGRVQIQLDPKSKK
ncbi:LptA/OstA family protein [Rhizobium sp. L1K21]|uniref:LptA/OstA family protein n=1 Tax=Rhizobium sp. L1K21 TaxID=2954933 RepID=UPI002091F2F9|nr:LptA/OstA family protein [Rhizobium sp. L1K21]MCO6187359.1 LptA/OstA family protein [Rhizobium sp. L1K21]